MGSSSGGSAGANNDAAADTGKGNSGGTGGDSAGSIGYGGSVAGSGGASAGSGGKAGSAGSAGSAGAGDSAAGQAGNTATEGGADAKSNVDAAPNAEAAASAAPEAGESGTTAADSNIADTAAATNDASTDSAPSDASFTSDAVADAGVETAASPSCGDGIQNGTEQCDHGSANSDLFYSGCTTTCQQTSLITWLDGKDPNGNGTSIADGTFIPKWADKARGIDAIQGTASEQPAYSTSGVGGVPGMLFDGSNDSLALPVDINYTAIPNMTVIAVFKNAPGNTGPYAGVWGQDDGGWDRFMVAGGPGGTGISNGNGFTSVAGLTAESVPIISMSTLSSGGSSMVYVGGVLAASFTETHNNLGTTSLSIGDLNGPSAAPFGPFDGVIAEIMIFNRALTSQERNSLGSVLATKYGATQYCGDGVRQGTEVCDDGVNDGSGCDADCTSSPSANILLHCDGSSQVLQNFTGAGCHDLTVGGGASYITLLNATTQARLYPLHDCSGDVYRDVTTDLNFCDYNFNNGSGLNDQVWSAFLSK